MLVFELSSLEGISKLEIGYENGAYKMVFHSLDPVLDPVTVERHWEFVHFGSPKSDQTFMNGILKEVKDKFRGQHHD